MRSYVTIAEVRLNRFGASLSGHSVYETPTSSKIMITTPTPPASSARHSNRASCLRRCDFVKDVFLPVSPPYGGMQKLDLLPGHEASIFYAATSGCISVSAVGVIFPAGLGVVRHHEAHGLDLMNFAVVNLEDVRGRKIEGLKVHGL